MRTSIKIGISAIFIMFIILFIYLLYKYISKSGFISIPDNDKEKLVDYLYDNKSLKNGNLKYTTFRSNLGFGQPVAFKDIVDKCSGKLCTKKEFKNILDKY